MASNSNRGGTRPKSRDGRRLQGNSRSYRRETVGRDETGSDSFRVEASSEKVDNSNSVTRFRGDRPIYSRRGQRFRENPDTHEYRGYRNQNDDTSWKRTGNWEGQSLTWRNQRGHWNVPDEFNPFDNYRGRRNWSNAPRTGTKEYLDQVLSESWRRTQKSENQSSRVEHSRSSQESGSTSALVTQTFFRRPGKAAFHRTLKKSGDSWKEDYGLPQSFSSVEKDGESPGMTFVDSQSDVSGKQRKLEENQQPSAQSPPKPQVVKRNLKTPPFSNQELQSFLEGKPSEILKKLIAGKEKLLALLKLDEMTADTVILLVRVLSCMWYLDSVSEALYNQELNTVLSLIESSSFLSKHLTRYLAGLTTRQPEDLDDNDGDDLQSLSFDVKMIFELLQLFLQHKPTRCSDVGVPLILLQKVVTTTALDDAAFDPESSLMTQVQQLGECCNSLEQNQKRVRQRATEKPPPNNFRDIPVFPESTEIRQTAKPFLRKNIVHGKYENVEHYLDVQFRLLREDFVAPLREGVTEYLAHTSGRPQDIRLYYNVFIEKQKLGNRGVTHTLKFEMRNRNRRPERWEKRLLYGSFVCLSNDEFQHILCATVENRNPNDLANGFVDVRFLTKTSRALAGPFIMAESTAYFEAYRHVLQGLQKTNDDNFPFKKYIVDVASIVDPPVYLRDDDSVTYDLRSLLVDTEEAFDNDRKVKSYVKAAYVPIFYPESWPTAEELHLDESQTTALQTALTNEFSVIQGPPGTGKTFIGLKIIQILLDNSHLHGEDKSPILVVCYTNHALDQFLEGIIGFGEEKVVRVGGRSSSEVLDSKNIKSLKRERVHVPDGFVGIKGELKQVRELLQETEQTIQWILTTLSLCRKVILDVVVLRDYMRVSHYKTLTRQRPRGQNAKEDPTTHLLKWLKVDYSTNKNDGGSIPSQANDSPPEGESHDRTAINGDVLQQEYRPDVLGVANENDDNPSSDQNQESEDSDDQVCIEVEDEGYAIQQERQIDNTYDLNISLESNQSLEEDFFHECAALCVKLALDSTSAAELQKDEAMTDQEAKGVKNIWSLNIQDRWRLYRLWVKKFKGENEVELNENYKRYETLINDMAEISEEEDLAILREANVVGMTTTGAARWRSVLQLLGPRIVVVEEAAEVLEAHIVTTLTAKCQHLILIGDHQQLKPNPTVYRLAKLFNLDTSLFERMINNGVPCRSLTHQHRMRPEISNVMKKHFYEKLQDDTTVIDMDNIKGVQRNMFFINHQQLEDGVDDNRTRSNQHEAKFLVELCSYLLRQGYKPTQITILTAYTGQLFCFRRLMDKATFKGVRVCVVDNFQGEENDIILLSLVRSNEEGSIGFLRTTNRVCVALSRARMGFYCIGNATILKKAKIWQDIMSTLEAQHQIGSSLPLVCQNHPDKVTHVSTAKDFSEKVPSGGCDRACGCVLSCGHVCTLFCHPCDTRHEGYRCQKPCKRLCRRGEHLCPLQCYQPCPTFCKMEVPKLMDNCGHEIQVFCYKFDSVTCPLPCPRGFTSCHHRCRKQCGETCPQTCPEKCERKLACGHSCTKQCGGPCNSYCSVQVKRTLPKCGHRVDMDCSRTDASCSEPCPRVFDLCHHRCRLKCGQNCRKTCPEKCEKKLTCGHPCTKLCGNPCARYCAVQVEKALPNCGHKMSMDCSTNVEVVECQKWVRKTHPKCGHDVLVSCSEDPKEVRCKTLVMKDRTICGHRIRMPCYVMDANSIECQERCQKTLGCGHQCPNMCGKPCEFSDISSSSPVSYTEATDYSMLCEEIVEKSYPFCEHVIKLPCHQEVSLVPCSNTCGRLLSCGHRCPRKCTEPCPIEKPCGLHAMIYIKYTTFSEFCTDKCEKVLSCGHPCPNKCGEPCPDTNFTAVGLALRTRYRLMFSTECEVLVEKKLPNCSHTLKTKCSENIASLSCSENCNKELPCGHHCTGKCSEPCKCREKVAKRLPICGHVAQLPCSQDASSYVCDKKCEKELTCGHQCPNKCGDPCPGEELALSKVPLTSTTSTKTSVHVSSASEQCKELVEKKLPSCGHVQAIPCYQDVGSAICFKNCEKVLSCGHRCPNICGEPCPEETSSSSVGTRSSQRYGRFNRCEEIVAKVLSCGHVKDVACWQDVSSTDCWKQCTAVLSCGHTCGGDCGRCEQGTEHVPCTDLCERQLLCGHMCNKKCSTVCSLDCWRCEKTARKEHGYSWRYRGEAEMLKLVPCKHNIRHRQLNTNACILPCRLPNPYCGHTCIGVCGEPCPPFCLECSRWEVTEKLPKGGIRPRQTFIYLPDCRHLCETRFLDGIVATVQSLLESGFFIIRPLLCPKCKEPIRNCPRYKDLLETICHCVDSAKQQCNERKIVAFGRSHGCQEYSSTGAEVTAGLKPFVVGKWIRCPHGHVFYHNGDDKQSVLQCDLRCPDCLE